MARNQDGIDRAARKVSELARSGKAQVDVGRISTRSLEQIVQDSKHNSPLSRKAATELAKRGPGRR